MEQLLIVDDDVELCDLLAEYLSTEGFHIEVVHNGEDAVKHLLSGTVDLMILDVMMPKMNGFETLREVRKRHQTPVLMLTARGDDIDRIVGLEMGADDYMSKPCNPRELVARIRAILRRSQTASTANDQPIRVDAIALFPGERKVTCLDQVIDLTGTEFNVLAELLKKAGQVVSKKQLTENVLGRKLTQYDRSMDMHVSNLRKKLGSCPDQPARIKSIRGVGYIYIVEQQGQPE
jgi:two-component system response regulator CpxR